MNSLNPDWFVEGTLDFEYKKYILLAYLQHVDKEFASLRLYPPFTELIQHYQNMASYAKDKKELRKQFPKSLDKEAFKQFKLNFEPEIEDQDNIAEIDTIIDYALPVIKRSLKEGKSIYEYIDEQLSIEPVGILPLHKKEGYLLLKVDPNKEVRAYEYQIVFFENTEANYHGLSMRFITSFTHSISNTFEAIKHQLIKSYRKFPNPATYLLHSRQVFPVEPALLPVAKRKFLSYMS